LTYPPLPPRTASVHDTLTGYRLVHGRYVVTTETRAFCAAARPTGCADQGWEDYGPGRDQSLPSGDLAGSYTWEGDFVVRADPQNGDLDVVMTPGVRLVSRERVGVAVRVGLAHETYWQDGLLHLRFNPMRADDGSAPDDSPPGRPETVDPWPYPMTDVRGGLRDYAVRTDADIVIGEGITGLGRPRGTPTTLRRFLGKHPSAGPALWLVLDARGRVLRVVVEYARPVTVP
jgi:hypothetical protein